MMNQNQIEIPKLVMDILGEGLECGEYWDYDIRASRNQGMTWADIVKDYHADCDAQVRAQGSGGCHCGNHTPWPGLTELG